MTVAVPWVVYWIGLHLLLAMQERLLPRYLFQAFML